MKKIVLLVVVALMANVTFAQDCKKVCEVKDSYTVKGELVEAILYHNNGKIAQTGTYTMDGQQEGEWMSFDAEGNKTAKANYKNGEKVGTWYFYNGDEKKEVTYADSRIAKVQTWKTTDTRVVLTKNK